MAQKIIEYWMCTSITDSDLDGYVNEKIKEGFQPYGTPFMMATPSSQWDEEPLERIFVKDGVVPVYAQAMVKYED